FCRVAAFALPGLRKQHYQPVMPFPVGPRNRSAAGQFLKMARCQPSGPSFGAAFLCRFAARTTKTTYQSGQYLLF
ncbi:hypothetical protein, partial [Klebsiella quasipneumoniae]|uniref:hypothetical protein n=1 Tax=Klebsiella quasipneumoniae TaxID=1463165 RepID=UPI001B7D7CBF